MLEINENNNNNNRNEKKIIFVLQNGWATAQLYCEKFLYCNVGLYCKVDVGKENCIAIKLVG